MILSIDSHSYQCLVCLSNKENLIANIVTYEPNHHDKFLAEFTRQLLIYQQIKIEDLEAIAIVSGPGSFTGLRIGFAFVEGIAIERNINLIKIPTMEIYAFQALELAAALDKEKIIAIVPGSSNTIFYQEFDLLGNSLTEIITINSNELIFDKNHLFVGNFSNEKYQLNEKLGLNVINPKSLVKLTSIKFQKQEFTKFDKFEPDYHYNFIPKTKS